MVPSPASSGAPGGPVGRELGARVLLGQLLPLPASRSPDDKIFRGSLSMAAPGSGTLGFLSQVWSD